MSFSSFCSLLFILFLGLRLTNFISWSWIWVAAPLWIPFSLFVFVMFLVGLLHCISRANGGKVG